MSIYAKDTSVSVEKSRAEIESTLARYGASQFGYVTDSTKAAIRFQANDRHIMFLLVLPDRQLPEFTHFRGKQSLRRLPEAEAYDKWEQACRQKWRCLALAIKAKLEAVESGITTFENEFMSNIVMPDGKTFAEHARPAIQTAYETGHIPSLLPDWSGSR